MQSVKLLPREKTPTSHTVRGLGRLAKGFRHALNRKPDVFHHRSISPKTGVHLLDSLQQRL